MATRLLIALLTLAYPFIVLWGLQTLGIAAVAFFLVALSALRYWFDRRDVWLYAMLASVALGGITFVLKDAVAIKLYPVVVNAVMLAMFAASLKEPECLIEKFARLQNPDLPPETTSYLRGLTKIWCAFFILNGTAAAITTFFFDDTVWALYNGCVSYVLMGCLFAGEFLYRKLVLRV